MIEHLIPLVASFLRSDWLSVWYYPLLALAFLATFPRFIRNFFER